MSNAPQEVEYQYRGDLRETILPEMLYTIYRHRVAGRIELRRDEVTKIVYIRDGAVIHASSSDIGDSLGYHLRRSGTLTTEQCTSTRRERSQGQKRDG